MGCIRGRGTLQLRIGCITSINTKVINDFHQYSIFVSWFLNRIVKYNEGLYLYPSVERIDMVMVVSVASRTGFCSIENLDTMPVANITRNHNRAYHH